jgi:hypothetical protein
MTYFAKTQPHNSRNHLDKTNAYGAQKSHIEIRPKNQNNMEFKS